MNERFPQTTENYKEEQRGTVPRDTLLHRSVRLTPNQIHFLNTIPNASQWIRDAINEKLFREKNSSKPKDRIIILSRHIATLKLQIARLENAKDYSRARSLIRFHNKAKAAYEGMNKEEASKIIQLQEIISEGRKSIESKKESNKITLLIVNMDSLETEKVVTIEKDENEEVFRTLSKKIDRDFMAGEKFNPILEKIARRQKENLEKAHAQLEKINEQELRAAKRICEAYEQKINELRDQIEQYQVEIQEA